MKKEDAVRCQYSAHIEEMKQNVLLSRFSFSARSSDKVVKSIERDEQMFCDERE